MQRNELKQIINQYFKRLKSLPRGLRQIIAIILIVLGFFGFLPVIGFWMIPLGLMLLAIDFRWARRLLTRLKYQYRRITKIIRKKMCA